MSAAGPPDDRSPGEDPDDDPFAFPPDAEDAAGDPERPADDGRDAGDRPPAGPDDDPFAFPPDAEDAAGGRDAAPVTPGPAPPAPARTPAERDEEERTARVRTAAEEASRHAQAVGVRWLAVALVVFLVVVGITTLGGGRGASGGDVQPGERLPVFAAPLATQPELAEDDVNVATKDGQGEAGGRAACSIRNRSVVTSCALLDRGPLVLVLYSGGVADCVAAVDELDRLRPRFPRLQTLAVATLGEHDAVAATVRARRWSVPTVYDADGGLTSLLGAPACPLVLFVRPDGTVAQRIIGRLPAGALERGMRRLQADRGSGTRTVDGPPPGR
jgi:hypothetical protein